MHRHGPDPSPPAHANAAHERHTGRARSRRVLVAALGITVLFATVELAGGIIAHSLALVADAGHMFGDALALALSLVAVWLAARPTTARRTYGFNRAEILAAQCNGVVLAAVALWTIWNAVERLAQPVQVHAGPVLLVAGLGVLANALIAAMLFDAGRENLNVRGALLDAASDTLGALGTIAAGIVIALTGWLRADAVASLGISVLILVAAWRLLREVVNVLLEGTPPSVNLAELQQEMRAAPGVAAVHDVHVWTVTSGFVALSAHVELDGSAADHAVLDALRELLSQRFAIVHATMQLESSGHVAECVEMVCEPARAVRT
jgi:cobalt-zinc-cadmium efflux system protein